LSKDVNIEVTTSHGSKISITLGTLRKGCLLSSKPSVVEYKAHEDAIPNIVLLNDSLSSFAIETSSKYSGVKIIDKSLWSSKGFEVVTFSPSEAELATIKEQAPNVNISALIGKPIVIAIADWTANEIIREEETLSAIDEADVDTVGQLKDQLNTLLLRLDAQGKELEALKSGKASNSSVLDKAQEDYLKQKQDELLQASTVATRVNDNDALEKSLNAEREALLNNMPDEIAPAPAPAPAQKKAVRQ
jgi:hypothetical protein